jgi:DNA polymerase-3 subunit delta
MVSSGSAMNYSEFVKSAENPEPVYLLMTDQAYLRDRVLQFCESRLDESARTFDWSVFDLAEEGVSGEVVSAQARTLPWMSLRRWIYVRHADAAPEGLKTYLESPSDRAVVVLEVAKAVRGWPKLPTIELDGRGKGEAWLRRKAKQEGFEMSRDAADLLVQLLGEDFQRLDAELEKLILWAWKSKQIGVDAVLALTAEAREHDVFELVGAMAGRNKEDALLLLHRLIEGGMQAPSILGVLYWSIKRLLVLREMMDAGQSFSRALPQVKLWSFKGREREVRRYSRERLIDLLLRLRESDRLLKSSGADARVHLDRLIVDTC